MYAFDNSPSGLRRLEETLARTPLFACRPQDDSGSALRDLAAAVQPTVQAATAGRVLLSAGDWTSELLVLLSGTVNIVVNGSVVQTRAAQTHVGEMALIDPSAPRSADVVAKTDVVYGTISEESFVAIASGAPWLWRSLALELTRRLRDRGALIAPPNNPPSLFVGYSSEQQAVAESLHRELVASVGDGLGVRLWTDAGAFPPSIGTLEQLEQHANQCDFAVLILAPDDTRTSRGTTRPAPRDNVVFEFGLFIGALGRQRAFAAIPDAAEVALPSDLYGVTALRYLARSDGVVETKAAADAIVDAVQRCGPKVRVLEHRPGTKSP